MATMILNNAKVVSENPSVHTVNELRAAFRTLSESRGRRIFFGGSLRVLAFAIAERMETEAEAENCGD